MTLRGLLAVLVAGCASCVPSKPSSPGAGGDAGAVASTDSSAQERDVGLGSDATSELSDSGVARDAVVAGDAEDADGSTAAEAGALDDAALPDASPGDVQFADAGTVTSTSCEAPVPGFTALEQALVDLPADSWFEAPDTAIRPLCPPNIDGCANIINAWSGGAWDDVHRRMLVFGGGHGDYAGNELFGFDLATMTWSILSVASDPALANTDPLPDGKPVSRHSYDGLQYLTHANVFWAHGGSRWQDGSGTNVTWTYASETNRWTNMMPTGNAVSFSGCCSESSAYDPVSRLIIDRDNNFLRSYDVTRNVWTQLADLGYPPLWPRYAAAHEPTGAIDARRRNVWFVGGNLFMVYDLTNAAFVSDAWVTTGGASFSNAADIGGHTEQLFTSGGGEVITSQGPGFAYDPTADDFVAFVSGAPWILDLETKAWTQGSAVMAPALTASSRGTYGRWRYVARVNAFILVNDVDQNVYFYKHTPRCGR
ncbi:MAG: hypothetical protein IT384_27035 [Deltaproteobacteria bacterium]|nr:hypothetical protein [Deltaproteobacteria bacterium]